MWERFEKLMKEKKLRISDVSRETGISYSTFTDWKAGRYHPKMDKMLKIAEYFGVSYAYLIGRTDDRNYVPEKKTIMVEYYTDDDTAELAQQAFDKQKILLDASRGLKEEDLQILIDMAKRMKQTNPDG